MSIAGAGTIWKVSIHAPVRERPDFTLIVKRKISFNPRSREGATSDTTQPAAPLNGFNPRSREGATIGGDVDAVPEPVSIHAPVRERRAAMGEVKTMESFQSTLP